VERHAAGDIVYYAFKSWRDSGKLTHAISTRHGGTSRAPFDTLNLGHTVGDDAPSVETNIRLLHSALGLDAAATVTASQAQADAVAIVTNSHRGTRVANVDALLTRARGVPLMLRYADCVPIFLWDPIHAAIGVVHAGWRGTVKKVTTRAACAMFDAFGTQPRDLLAAIGPSIGPCCYSIGPEVVLQVQAAFGQDKDLLEERGGSVYFDLWQANASQLLQLGVEQVQVARVCTAEHTGDFYSARAEKGKTGRFAAMIALA
jgi:YfiH family protein